MCWLCDHPGATIDDALDNVRAVIDRNGWAVQCVENPSAPWAYTIGLHAFGLPELLVTGLEPQAAGSLLNHVADVTMGGIPFTPGTRTTADSGMLVEVVEVDHPDAHMNVAMAIEGPFVTARQLVWADERGRMPWERGYRRGRRSQPVWGVRSAPGRG